MKKIILAAMAVMLTLNAGAAEKKDGEKANQPVFTTVKANFVDHFNGVRGDDRKSPFGKNKILLEAFKQYKLNVGMR